MKRTSILYILLFCTSLSTMLVSCRKELEAVVPQDMISTNLALTDANAAQTLYVGVYARLRAYNATLFNLGEMRSDIWADGIFTESADATSQQLYTHNISSLNVPYSSWGNFYNLIYQVNNAISVLPKSPASDATKNRWLAELYGIRAFIYYTMLKTWGPVPLTTEAVKTINNAAETYKARSSADSVMLQVKSDVNKSLDLFGTSNVIPTGNRVYWNRVASLILKGDAYIWAATHLGKGNTDLTTAKTALQEVKNAESATLKLNTTYGDCFDPLKKANNPEIVFALNYEAGQSTQGTFSIFTVNGVQSSSYSFVQAATPTVQTSYPFVNGANRVGMSQTMINRLTAGAADQRIAYSFKVMYSSVSPFPTRGVLLSKWIGVTSGSSQVYSNDFPIYRYADALLLLAEAKAKLGEDPSAEINQIRTRGYGAGTTTYVNSTVTDNMNAILEEYLREFIGEGKRWWALRRAGDDYVYANIKPAFLSPSTTAKMLLPITTGMINNDPLLTQTPGY